MSSKSEKVDSGSGAIDNTMCDADEFDFEPVAAPLIKIKTRSKGKQYELHSSYNNIQDAEQVLSGDLLDSQWYLHKTTSTAKGSTRWYKCKQGSRSKGEQCPKTVQVVCNTTTEKVTILYSSEEHHHNAREGEVKHGIDPLAQLKIAEYESLGLKPAQMLIQLRQVTTRIPTQLQLNNFLKDLRKKDDGELESKICLNDFKYFYDKHKEIPENPDQMFAADLFIEVKLEQGEMTRIFRIFLTTKRLLSFTNYVSVIFY